MLKDNFTINHLLKKFLIILVLLAMPTVCFAENSMDLEVKPGDTLSGIMRTADITYRDTANALDALRSVYNPGSLKVGQKVTVFFDILDGEEKKLTLQGLQIKPSKLTTIEVVRVDEKLFSAKKRIIPTTKTLVKTSAIIKSTLFGAAKRAGVPNAIRNQFIKNYSYDVDFQREIYSGNSFEILYEALLNPEGEVVDSGNIIYSSLKLKKNTLDIYRYTTTDGSVDYYDDEGRSIKKSFLRTPVDGARITSAFGKRKHPILGYNRMHKGLDFGASRGTPVYAAGPGVIMQMNRNGSYGNYVKIRHANGYETAYAHLHKFNTKLRRGRKVKQGQVIGYVGTTGRSTGPHLHYEVIKYGRQINPLSIKAASINKLKSLEYGVFEQYKNSIIKLALKLDTKSRFAELN